jgi:hypothetical protein
MSAEGDDDDSHSIESLRLGLEDARRTHDQQLEAFNDIGEKAWRIVRLNGIVATIYVAVIANTFRNTLSFTLISFTLISSGLALLLISALVSLSGQREQSVIVGNSPEAFSKLREHEPNERVYLKETLKGYEHWIQKTSEQTDSNGKAVRTAKYCCIAGVSFIMLGTIIAVA